MKKRLYLLLGPPGSGKGTQAERLGKELKIHYYSVGDLLRQEVNSRTVLGGKELAYMEKGILVPNEIVVKMMLQKLVRSRKSLIFDGFPRNLAQTKSLDKFLQERNIQTIVIELALPEAKILERIIGRRYCVCGHNYHVKFKPSKVAGKCDACGGELKVRPDAQPAIVKKRIKIYNREKGPVISFYKKHKAYWYYKINGDQSIDKVHNDLLKKLRKLND